MTSEGRTGTDDAPLGMRTARPTASLERTRRFYADLVGLRVLAEFADHDGFDGVVFGIPDERAQLEIVSSPHAVVPRPTVEDALVLFAPPGTVAEIRARLRAAGVVEFPDDDPDLNPYWPRAGATAVVDPDGYVLVLAPT